MPKTITLDAYKVLLKQHAKALREYIDLLDKHHTDPGTTTAQEALSVAGRLIEVRGELLVAERSLKAKYWDLVRLTSPEVFSAN